ADDNLGVAKIDTANKAIHLEHAHMFGMTKTDTADEWGAKIVGYYAYNILEEIDMPGEYYIDRNNGIMYYYPVEGFENAEISVSVLEDPVLAVENTSDILFENIILECGKGMGIYLEAGSDVQFAGCTIRNFGTVGAMFGQGVSGNDKPIHNFTGELTSRTVGNLKAHHYENTDFENNAGKNHGFLSCDFYNLGTGAIVLSGGDRKTLTPAGNYIENCEIHDFNRWNKTYCSGIKLYGVGNIIKNNHIYNAPHQAIEIFGNEHFIEYNHIEKVVMEVHDMGAIYMGRNPSERGNVVRHNYIAHNGKKGFKNCAIHVDDGASDMLIEGNVFYKTSRSDFADILLNGGNDNIIKNNIFIKGAHTLWIENPYLAGIPEEKFNERYYKSTMWGERMLKEINMNSPAWKEKYPDFEAFDSAGGPLFLKNLEFYNNVIVDEPLIISKHDIDTSIFEVYHHNYQTEEDPGFVNMEEENFNLKDNSVVFENIPGFKPIPFDEIGLFNDKYRKLKNN
ncbi:MAG: right-handed parallel beta-helix repeat-containing protein, partial [Bacteroidota bacterium]